MKQNQQAPPWTRVAIVLAALGVLCGLSYAFTGSVLPTERRDALIFQNGILLIVLGSALKEHKFTIPADSMINALMGMVTLFTVYGLAPMVAWWAVFAYCFLVFSVSALCVAVSEVDLPVGWRRVVSERTYQPAVFLGASRRLFSVLFLFGVLSFYHLQSERTLALVLFWGLFVVAWPLGLAEALSRLRRPRVRVPAEGRVVRTDSPGLIRVALKPRSGWSRKQLKVYQQVDGRTQWVLPLYSQTQEDGILATGLLVGSVEEQRFDNLERGMVYGVDPAESPKLEALLGGGRDSKLVGFVVERSKIGEIRFETWDASACKEGMLAWCSLGTDQVFYQVTSGETVEEALETDRHGFQVASAAQLGVLRPGEGFAKHPWLPAMNTPVFAEPKGFGQDITTWQEGDFVYGRIPHSEIQVGGPFLESYDHHTAILGVTGSGKTELAFDLVRFASENGQKVICIDLTVQYRGRLQDLEPQDLSISPGLAAELGEKLFDVETGQYGAGNEKKALQAFAGQLRQEVSRRMEEFLCSGSSDNRVGLIELKEISNTKATLYITELYLTCLLHFARDRGEECPPVLVVVEEAHTVMPEPSTMGLGDYDSRGLVGKIAQIALQGRKFGVGLLVLAQRTATVSKTVLTQCNTVISFNCFDDTSLGFLKNIFGRAHIELIPNLPFLNAVVFGKGIRSERPVQIEIPYDERKALLSRQQSRPLAESQPPESSGEVGQ